jgi:predicted membrane protein
MSLEMNESDIKKHNNGKVMAGVIVLIVGTLLLMRKLGVLFPNWLLSWPMLLIAIGFYTGFKHQFKNNAWWIVTSIGVFSLLDKFFIDMPMHQYFWPVLIIIIGLTMIFGKKNKKWDNFDWKDHYDKNAFTSEEYLDSVSIFGGVKKNIVSKDFKGGSVVCVMGGAEINLSQAEINGQVELEMVNIMGGTKLIVPANWEIKTEVVAVFGSIEDKRVQQSIIPTGENVLVLRGTCIFGGIDIKSF